MPDGLVRPYFAAWFIASILALTFVARSPSTFAITRCAYWHWHAVTEFHRGTARLAAYVDAIRQ